MLATAPRRNLRVVLGHMANERGISISELTHTAALAAASEELDLTAGERESAIAEVRAQVKTLAETVSRIWRIRGSVCS